MKEQMSYSKEQPEINLHPALDDFLIDDSNFSFRVNSRLKKEFQRLCKRDRYSAASVLKRFMIEVVRSQKVGK